MSRPLRSRWLDWPDGQNQAGTGTVGTLKTVKRADGGAFDGFEGGQCTRARDLFSATRLGLADCLTLLDDMHARIRADYEPGAAALLDTDPRIYGGASMPQRGGLTSWRARRMDRPRPTFELPSKRTPRSGTRSSRDTGRTGNGRPSEPTRCPSFPADTVAAVGISYGDGEAGTWDVVRRGR